MAAVRTGIDMVEPVLAGGVVRARARAAGAKTRARNVPKRLATSCSAQASAPLPTTVPPRASSVPLIGDTLWLILEWERCLTQRVREQGPVFTTNLFGEDTVIICDARIGKAFAERHEVNDMVLDPSSPIDQFFSHQKLTDLGGLSDPNLVGKAFQARKRAAWSTTFSPRHLPACMPVIRDILESEFRKHDGSFADVTEILHRATLQVVWYRFTGNRADAALTNDVTETMAAFCSAMKFAVLPKWLNPKFKSFEGAVSHMRGLCSSALEDAKAEYAAWKEGSFEPGEDKATSMLWQLLKLAEAEGVDFDAREAQTAAENALFAGHETTRWAISGLLIHLQQNPDVLLTVREELMKAGDASPIRGAKEMGPYSEAVLWENLRMIMGDTYKQKNAAFMFPRRATKDLTCGDYLIPKGTKIVLMLPYMLQGDPAFRPADADAWDSTFNPQRFVKGGKVVKPEGFPVFGFGPRVCAGMGLALSEIRVVLDLVATGGMSVRFDDPDTEWAIHSLTSSPVNSRAYVSFEKST